MSLDLGITKYNEGYDVYFVSCDESVGICGFFNPRGCTAICRLCKKAMKKQIMDLVNTDKERYHYLSVSSLMTAEIKHHADNLSFAYEGTKELKSLVYKDVEIGFAAFSAFVSLTRNVMPTYNDALKSYLNDVLKSEVRLTDALCAFIDKIKPNLIVFHNGRMPNCKPLYGLAKAKCIDFISTERIPANGECIMDNFPNDIPHSNLALHKKIDIRWAEAGEEKYEIGRKFYENRYHSMSAGDTIYTKNQKLGELPIGFDASKRNIAIFNSSEDEYFSVSKDWDEACMFPTQYVALKTIFEHYKDNRDIHFYLRIHPNLANVPYKSHTLLYELKYDNVTIIEPSSPISSYTLMENSEKILVFGSTMGLESSYWGKPVITMCGCFYSNKGVVYEPKNEIELFILIDNKNLPCKEAPKEVYYKLAYRLMRQVGDKLNFFKCNEKVVTIPVINKPVKVFSAFKLCGSPFLYGLLYEAFDRIAEWGLFTKYGKRYMKKTI